MLFNTFSPLAGGNLSTYYNDKEYPYDLNGSLDFTRPATGVSIFPFPLTIGYIDGLVPQFNALSFQTLGFDQPFGPWTGLVPTDTTNIFPNYSGLTKTMG